MVPDRFRGRSRWLERGQENRGESPGRPARWSPKWMEVFRLSAVGIVVLTTPFRARRPGSALSGGGCWGAGGCRGQRVAGLQRSAGVHTGAHHGIPGVTDPCLGARSSGEQGAPAPRQRPRGPRQATKATKATKATAASAPHFLSRSIRGRHYKGRHSRCFLRRHFGFDQSNWEPGTSRSCRRR